MNENAIHGAPKKGREWKIALSNHYAWLQTRGWRMHEGKRNSWGSKKTGREWRIAISNHYTKRRKTEQSSCLQESLGFTSDFRVLEVEETSSSHVILVSLLILILCAESC